ncbi:MAG TPA: hypothetical protein VJ579_02750 [Candidatus Paceibacterota bacterium]|nr:hypothetical protein [Candidatus Paceibacterota bacterium]
MQKYLRFAGITVVLLFALIGFVFTVVFVGMQFGAFNVRGSIKERNDFFQTGTTKKEALTSNSTSTQAVEPSCVNGDTVCAWNETREWTAVSGGLAKDQAIINKVAKATGVSPRLIATIVVPEQTRFFTAEREVFKRYFEPLKILGSLSKFSLGVSGIKQDTALLIEQYANDPTSPFYPGDAYAPLIAYETGVDHDKVLYDRLTDAKNHEYSYLYTALFVKEIATQWKNAGFDISNNPGAIVTLFNIGFKKSRPNANPQLGGAEIITGGKTYTYGELGSLFFSSAELRKEFPN